MVISLKPRHNSKPLLTPTCQELTRLRTWLLGDKDGCAARASRRQVLVRLADIFQLVALVDDDLHDALLHHVEQFACCLLQGFPRGDIVEQDRARGEQRSLLLQEVDAEGWHHAGGLPEADKH